MASQRMAPIMRSLRRLPAVQAPLRCLALWHIFLRPWRSCAHGALRCWHMVLRPWRSCAHGARRCFAVPERLGARCRGGSHRARAAEGPFASETTAPPFGISLLMSGWPNIALDNGALVRERPSQTPSRLAVVSGWTSRLVRKRLVGRPFTYHGALSWAPLVALCRAGLTLA